MDLSKVKPSKSFEDHTDYTKVQRLLDTLFTKLNPVTAARNFRKSLIRADIIDPTENGLFNENKLEHTKDLYQEALFQSIMNNRTLPDLRPIGLLPPMEEMSIYDKWRKKK